MRLRADELQHALTDDGRRLALHHYKSASPRRRHSVICCHGLAANHLAFDVAPGASLARHLCRRGYDVFALDLRGHGASERPPFGWAFDDYLVRDVPAAIARVKTLSAGSQVHWIGHSMGGILGLAHMARGHSRDLRSAITVGSSLDYSGTKSGFHRLLFLRRLLELIPAVPIGSLARLSAAFVGTFATPYERFNVWSDNCDPALWRLVCEEGFHAVSPPVMAQLATAMLEGGLRSRSGDTHYLAGLAEATAPVLALAGSRDAQCPPDAAARTVAAIGSRAELLVFGKDQGHADHYGHFDLLMGRRASDEVYPHIDAWLDEHD